MWGKQGGVWTGARSCAWLCETCLIANYSLLCSGRGHRFPVADFIVGALTSYNLNALQLTYKDTSMVIIIIIGIFGR